MEGVGARLGRSSTRYGPTTVFTGPVRKWKKKWVHVTPPGSGNNHSHNHHREVAPNGNVNGSNGSHLLLYKWTPLTPSQNNAAATTSNSSGGDKDGDSKTSARDDEVSVEEPPRRKFKYIPIALLEEQKIEVSEQGEDDVKSVEPESNIAEPTSKSDGFDEKPDINDVPMEEHQDNPPERQDLNESTLDLSLGLKAHDGDRDPESKIDPSKDNQLERIKSISMGT